jgi:hypothetical protein
MLWDHGDPAGVPEPIIGPLLQTLRRLHAAVKLRDIALMGLDLRQRADGRYAVAITPAWELTFMHDWHVFSIDLERRTRRSDHARAVEKPSRLGRGL